MEKRSYSLNAKKRILEAAKKIFAEKGFDGARVDEIAEAAKVPKSLIYYHFDSKDAILEELLHTCLTEYQAILAGAHNDTLTSRAQPFSERIRTLYLRFLENNEDVFRIIGMESLKKHSSKAHLAFQFVEFLIKFEEKHLKPNQRFTEEERSTQMVTEFFTGHLPMVLFICFREAWSKYFNIDKETLAQQFLEAYDMTYGAYRQQK